MDTQRLIAAIVCVAAALVALFVFDVSWLFWAFIVASFAVTLFDDGARLRFIMRHRPRSISSQVETLERFGFRPEFDANGTPCSIPEQGFGPYRTFVASMPKAGTYLLAEVLAEFGVRWSKLHVDYGLVSDLRELHPGTRTWEYEFEMPQEHALRLVLPGQFAVGHLPPDEDCLRALEGFRIVFLFRDLRRALVSWARFVFSERMHGVTEDDARRHPDGPERVMWVLNQPFSAWFVPLCTQMVAWRNRSGTFSVRFEDLVGDNGPGAQARCAVGLARHLELPVRDEDAAQAASACVRRNTLTYAGSPSQLSKYWDDRLESWFRAAVNADLLRMVA